MIRAERAGARPRRPGRSRRLAAVLAAASLAVAGCASATSAGHSSAPVHGGTVSYGFVSGSQPNWIFPYDSPAYSSTSNLGDLQELLYRPLYWFGGQNGQPTVDYGLSAADPPSYRDGGRTVVIGLKGWKWSDGETVDAQDVLFWLQDDGGRAGGLLRVRARRHPAGHHLDGGDRAGPGDAAPQRVLLQPLVHLQRAVPDHAHARGLGRDQAGAAPGSGGCAADTSADHWAQCKAVSSS